MNRLAEKLATVLARELPNESIQWGNNDADSQVEAGSLRAELYSAFDSHRRLVVLQRGNTVEVTYDSGAASDAGPAERQFVFETGQESEGFQAAAAFAKQVVTENILVVRQKHWFSRKTQLSFAPAPIGTRARKAIGIESWRGTYDS